ncbi:MAG: sulfite exporter TauE/SafE family protein [Euryarchaeota archaeon]|nr:sulfite exporter TauE/SafE family protein [Euryarchaeota archaeon]
MGALRLLPLGALTLIAGSAPVFASGGTGFLGLPGAPEPSLPLAFLWAVFVGWVFSTVGAFGGVLAGVGHLTVFGLGEFASSLRSTNPELSARVTDSIRVSNQWLVGLSAFISTFNYYRMRRIVVPLALALGSGAVIGSFVTPILTAGKLSLKAYLGYFGLFTLLVGFVLLYETTPRGKAARRRAYEAARAFEERIKREGDEVLQREGVRISEFSVRRITFTFFGQEFSFNPLLPFLGGLAIGSLASLLGVGGGFLYVPFLTSVVGLPYFIVAGTSALSVAIGMVVSIFSYMVIKQVPVHVPLLAAELLGVALGSYIGPRTSKYIPERYLKLLFALLAFYVGIRYLTKGFLGRSLLPPY